MLAWPIGLGSVTRHCLVVGLPGRGRFSPHGGQESKERQEDLGMVVHTRKGKRDGVPMIPFQGK
jgi:hypothetical protein